MASPFYVRPQAIVQQEFQAIAQAVIQPLNAVIVGAEKQVFQYTDADDRNAISYGAYDPAADTEYDYRSRPAGGVVEQKGVRLFLEDILASYAAFTTSSTVERGALANQIQFNSGVSNGNFKAFNNGTTNYPRHTLFKNRDVHVGDRVTITGNSLTLNTRVTGFINATVAASIDTPAAGDETPNTQAATSSGGGAVTVVDDGGTDHVVTVNTSTTRFLGNLAKGYITDTYTLEVTTAGAPTTAKFKVTSVEGDNATDVASVAFGTAFDVGSRGLRLSIASTGSEAFVVGEKYTVAVNAAYTKRTPTAAGTYDGRFDTTYKVRVVKGGLWSESPQVIITTSTGIDQGGPTTVAHNTSFNLGTLGATFKFGTSMSASITDTDATVTVASTTGLAAGMTVTGTGIPADTTILSITDATRFELTANATATNASVTITIDSAHKGLLLGETYMVAVTAAKKGGIKTITLANPIPSDLASAQGDDVNAIFSIYKDKLEIPIKGYPEFSSVALVADDTSFTVSAGIQIIDSTWTDTDEVSPLPLDVDSAKVFVTYTALKTDKVNILRSLSDLSSIKSILGKNIPENPLAAGVFYALSNSGGQTVYFISVASEDLDGFTAALEAMESTRDPYFKVALSRDRDILALFDSHVDSLSSDTHQNWCFGVGSAKFDEIVFKYSDKANGDNWTGYVAIEPGSSPAEYTRVTVPDATFITDGVRPGDWVYTDFDLDAFGNPTYKSAKIDSVVDEENLVLVSPGFSSAIGDENNLQQIQVVRILTNDEYANNGAAVSSSFASRRFSNVFPHFPIEVEHYFAAAAVAGLASSVAPHQPITNVAINGFEGQAGTFRRLTPTQLDRVAGGGTLVLTQDQIGRAHV